MKGGDLVWVWTSNGGSGVSKVRARLLQTRQMEGTTRMIGEVQILAADMPKRLRETLRFSRDTDRYTTWEPLTSMRPMDAITLLGELA